MLCEGQALVEAGESYRQLAEVKYSMEDTVKQNFLDPLAHIQNKDLKEVNVSFFCQISAVIVVEVAVEINGCLCVPFLAGTARQPLFSVTLFQSIYVCLSAKFWQLQTVG